MATSRRRPEACRAAPNTISPANTSPTASAGENGLPVLASDVAAAASAAGFTKFSPSTCVGTLVLVTAPPATVDAVVLVVPLFAVVVVVPLLDVVVVVPLFTVVVVADCCAGGQSCTQITLCLSPPRRWTVIVTWKPCCGCGTM